MPMRMRGIVAVAVLILCGTVFAEGFEKGDAELSFRISYVDVDFGSTQGLDLGGTTDAELTFAGGWLLTQSHELGLSLGYVKQEIEGGDVFQSEDTDGTSLGAFYNYNFTTTSSVTIPFIGFNFAALGGDVGDVYNFQYGVEAGLKIYPFEHGGVVFSIGYTELVAEEDQLPDGSALSLGGGLLLRF